MKQFGVIFFIISLVIIAIIYSNPGYLDEVPNEIYGKWETANPKFKDRYFDLSPEKVIFGIGDDNTVIYSLVGIQKQSEDRRVLYTVSFEDGDGNGYKQSFYFEGNDAEAIMFKNQTGIKWCKTVDEDD